MIDRPIYLDRLWEWRDKDVIKVLTGIRRAGKSTLLELLARRLQVSGVRPEQIIQLNFENPDLQLADATALYRFVQAKLLCGQKMYVMMDEVQNIKEFERAIDGLYLNKDVDLYITGSNAYLLSGELATLLSGRFVQFNILPLSLREYRGLHPRLDPARLYARYVEWGSFPYVGQLDTRQQAEQYVNDLYSTILFKDVLTRGQTVDASHLERITKFMLSNVGSVLSSKKIADTLTSVGQKITAQTVERYVQLLTNSYAFYPARRYDIRGKQFLTYGQKYYATDVAMRYSVIGRANLDLGHVLENVVYLELCRRGGRVYLGRVGDQEVDFVTETPAGRAYYQVALSVRDEATLEQELRPLRAISDNYPKTLLTLDVDPTTDYEGILKYNALDWLLGETEKC